MARGDSVDRIGVVRYLDAASDQLVTKSYRPGAGDRRGCLQRSDPFGQLIGPVDGGLPDPLARRRVKSGENLAAPAVQNGKPLPLRACLADPDRERVERADAARRQAEADAEAAGAGDPDPQAGERARPEPDREQVDRFPTTRRRGGPLDLRQQAGRVPGPPLRGEPQLRLVQYLAVAPGAGDGVNRRGVEADDDQGITTPSPGRPRTRLFCL
jgi:hypothetical protein